jgi:hypothetical protein
MTPTLTLRLREAPSANQSSFSLSHVTSETSEVPQIRDFSITRENASSWLQNGIISPFYLIINQHSMASENCTDSPLTTEPDNLTELHQLSGLQTTHSSRRTETGFVVRESRLPGCIPLPARKTPHRSWIWEHGHSMGRKDDNKVVKLWLCKTCYKKDDP